MRVMYQLFIAVVDFILMVGHDILPPGVVFIHCLQKFGIGWYISLAGTILGHSQLGELTGHRKRPLLKAEPGGLRMQSAEAT